MLDFVDINVAYGQLRVLTEINITVEKERIVSIIGANGAGKTTLLKTASGLIRPEGGTISFEGKPIHSIPPHEIVGLGIVHVPEGRQIFTSLSVEDNLRVGSYLPRARRMREQNMKRVYEMFPRLGERRKQLARTLSGGEQQMLAIGRGLMSMPRLLMLDEPSLGLAPLIVSNIFSVVREINRQGITILLVEQNVSHALKMSHWGYVIENRRIVLSGTGEELASNEHTKKAYFGGH
ncbi:MAG: ABC transporter ATP-binding protein [Deltaproteobacteria bacterium]|nr:ABC transporter ATP-binding protein [Deltaproteobacteria bacterium]MBW2123618.1 ABC transporter ATP-binding protein [Deltaproteobacteria bacterium]